MSQQALDRLRVALDTPKQSLTALEDAFEFFETNGPFHGDRYLTKIIQFKDRGELLADQGARQNPWYEYVLKRIAIPEWFDRLYESVRITKTIKEWEEVSRLCLWDEILDDLLNKATHSVPPYRAQGMCELFANYLTARIQQYSGERAGALETLNVALKVFMTDLRAFREKHVYFRQRAKLDSLSTHVSKAIKINKIKHASKLGTMKNLSRIESNLMHRIEAELMDYLKK